MVVHGYDLTALGLRADLGWYQQELAKSCKLKIRGRLGEDCGLKEMRILNRIITLIDAGFERGVANPCFFKNKSGTTSVMVHGDDFVAVGPETEVKEVENALAHKYKIKVETLGLGEGDKKEIRVLNRVIRMSKNDGVSLEADPRHAERVIREMGVEEAKASPIPGTKGEAKKATEKEEEDEEEPKELDQKDASRYRCVAATLNYLAADRADIQFATKEAARAMAKPTENDWIL